MIIQANICSNCRRLVPQHCDGKLYRVNDPRELSRPVCRGRDAENLHTLKGALVLRITVGHGHEYDVPLTEIRE